MTLDDLAALTRSHPSFPKLFSAASRRSAVSASSSASAALAAAPASTGSESAAAALSALLHFLDAAEQRDHFLGRVLDQLQVRAD